MHPAGAKLTFDNDLGLAEAGFDVSTLELQPVRHIWCRGCIHGLAASCSTVDRELGFAKQIEDAREDLDRLAMEISSSVTRVAGHLRVGSPDVEIAQLASDIGADWIVVGTNGHRGWDRLLLGSTAESLVKHAPCPVLTWRPKTVPAWNQIAPPCPDCLETQKATQRARLWCERHSQRHERAHTYYEVPPAYGIGSKPSSRAEPPG